MVLELRLVECCTVILVRERVAKGKALLHVECKQTLSSLVQGHAASLYIIGSALFWNRIGELYAILWRLCSNKMHSVE